MQTTILIGLFICHFLGDFTHLSTAWMLKAKMIGKPFLPILVHALVHATLMGIFLFLLGVDNVILLFIIQLTTHFIIDVLKGRMNGWFPILQSPTNKWHWIIFGFDQLFHALVIVVMSHYAIM